jgi:hypothetical protein
LARDLQSEKYGQFSRLANIGGQGYGYVMRNFIGFLLLFSVLLTSCVSSQKMTTESPKPISTPVSLFTSLVPGLTQLINGEYLEAAIYLAAVAVPVTGVVYTGATTGKWATNDTGGTGAATWWTMAAAGAYAWNYVDGFASTIQMNSRWNKANGIVTKKPSKEVNVNKGNVRIVEIGMTRQKVVSLIGNPIDKNTTVTQSSSVHEQWVYGRDQYVYFEDGKVSGIQY